MTERFKLHLGDCLETLRTLPDNSVDSIVTDPPYGLSKEPDMAEVLRHWMAGDDYQHKGGGFMGKTWDSFVPGPSIWRECLRVLKPGGYLLSFFGTRTQDIGTLAIRLAGFEIRDSIAWVYGSGFPKSLDVSKAIDKAAGAEREVLAVVDPRGTFDGRERGSSAINTNWRDAEGRSDLRDLSKKEITAPATEAARQWQGWGTALKPALEPITVARKPLIGTVATNVLAHGTGALNIDGCRIAPTGESRERVGEASQDQRYTDAGATNFAVKPGVRGGDPAGRWPANLIHDGSDEVVALFPTNAGASAPVKGTEVSKASVGNVLGERERVPGAFHADTGSAARFFYCAKASKRDRNEGCEHIAPKQYSHDGRETPIDNAYQRNSSNSHPTVKPTDLMAYLCRLVTPPGGVVLDPFMGSGSTGKAAMREGFRFIGCEMSPEYLAIAHARITHELEAETMRVIYCTPFDDETKKATGPSTDSGFTTIAEVVDAMGGEWLTCSDRAVVYPGLMFSDYVLRVES